MFPDLYGSLKKIKAALMNIKKMLRWTWSTSLSHFQSMYITRIQTISQLYQQAITIILKVITLFFSIAYWICLEKIIETAEKN